jgi:cytochrome c oxidase subunit II
VSELGREILPSRRNISPDQGETLPMKSKLLTLLRITAVFVVLFTTVQSLPAQAPRRIEVTAKRFTFTPGEITLKKGVPVVLVLTSADVDHGLKFKELNVNVKAKKGQTSEVNFTPDRVGTFVGQCSVFCGSGHGSMKLTLHVTE